MRVGLIGAQGVGKTTLAEAVSNETDLPLIFTKTSEVFHKLGLRPDKKLSFAERIFVQHKILDSAEELWASDYAFITDRTPLDMLAYTMIDFTSDTRLDEEHTRVFQAYVDRCIAATNEHFSTLVLVQPGLPFRQGEKSRAALDYSLVETMNTLMAGLMVRSDVGMYKSVIPREVLMLAKRVKAVEHSIAKTAENFTPGIENVCLH